MEQYINDLIHETSPYLLQHAHNPVNWVAWSSEVFERAREEQKLVLISVGYSSCHWCHVMEHESFEDEEVAAIMNKFFICIKVDREERPDVDNIYMKAVQMMTHQGGWPLNCFTLPDGRPIYGGTYFPKEQWMYILKSLQHTYQHDLKKVEQYANELTQGLRNSELIKQVPISNFEEEHSVIKLLDPWLSLFDVKNGGFGGAPKFPTPINLNFLIDLYKHTKINKLFDHYTLSLNKMALGGIYDQIGGGFSRYSVDSRWKVPHFEKMLYDNAQLISTFSIAYRETNDPMYKRIVSQTLDWVHREMKSPDKGYYAALDADSEGIEGKFYVWDREELEEFIANPEYNFEGIYNLDLGYWEHGNYILMRDSIDKDIIAEFGIEQTQFYDQLNNLNQALLKKRSLRIRPDLDNKCIVSWNALLLSGMCDAYRSFGDQCTLNDAIELAAWINGLSENGFLYRIKNDKKQISGFIEDYAFSIQAFIDLYQITFDIDYILQAKLWTEYALDHFCAGHGSMFKTSEKDELISNSYEVQDSVIPSPNSVMAWNLICLGQVFQNPTWKEHATQMLSNVFRDIPSYVAAYANWSRLSIYLQKGCPELKIMNSENDLPDRQLLSCLPSNILIINGNEHALPINADSLEHSGTVYLYCDIDGCRLPQPNVASLMDEFS